MGPNKDLLPLPSFPPIPGKPFIIQQQTCIPRIIFPFVYMRRTHRRLTHTHFVNAERFFFKKTLLWELALFEKKTFLKRTFVLFYYRLRTFFKKPE